MNRHPLRCTVGLRKISPRQARENALRVVVKAQLVELSKGHCQNCGKRPDWRGLSLSHEIPLSKGGKTNTQNCKVKCFPCHNGPDGHRTEMEPGWAAGKVNNG